MEKNLFQAAAALGDLSLPDVVTQERLAAHLDLPLHEALGYLRRGLLPGKKIGGRWYVSRRAFLSFLESPPARPDAALDGTREEERRDEQRSGGAS